MCKLTRLIYNFTGGGGEGGILTFSERRIFFFFFKGENHHGKDVLQSGNVHIFSSFSCRQSFLQSIQQNSWFCISTSAENQSLVCVFLSDNAHLSPCGLSAEGSATRALFSVRVDKRDFYKKYKKDTDCRPTYGWLNVDERNQYWYVSAWPGCNVTFLRTKLYRLFFFVAKKEKKNPNTHTKKNFSKRKVCHETGKKKTKTNPILICVRVRVTRSRESSVCAF